MRYHDVFFYPLALSIGLVLGACSPDESIAQRPGQLSGLTAALVQQEFASGQFAAALATCDAVLSGNANDCDAHYCDLLARTLLFTGQLNTYLLPRYRSRGALSLNDVAQLLIIDEILAGADQSAGQVISRGCSYDLPHLPVTIGDAPDAADLLVQADVRGIFTPRDAEFLDGMFNAFRYLLANLIAPVSVPPPPGGSNIPGLPTDLQTMGQDLSAQDALLFSQQANPSTLLGGWLDRNGDGIPDSPDELLVDWFVPGSSQRVFDFSTAEFVPGQQLPGGALTPTSSLPPPRCGYQKWHIDTLLSGPGVGTTDGMSFSPDGTHLVLPIQVNGTYQINLLNSLGQDPVCLTCQAGSGQNDGVRWRPAVNDALLFVSDRDHPYAIGGAGGGAGQELYVMRSDGSAQTRLTISNAWATNYHPNWSFDGQHIVWGSTQARTWDVMVADYIEDNTGPHLANVRRVVHDTTWWETHGFSLDGSQVIVSNTRAGFQSSDIYAVNLVTGARTRLTTDLSWDEHAHLSPDGRKLAWMSGRYAPAAMSRLTNGGLSPIFDFFWIIPGVFFDFIDHPAGFATELTIMDADGTHLQQLTNDQLIVADSEWSPDATRIIFRQSQPKLFGSAQVRLLTFDDCQ